MRSVVGEYLEAIYSLHAEGEDAFAVTLAELFGVSRANASATVDRLARDGLARKDGRQVLLTPAGRERAEAGLRRHRVTERFLADVLGIDWATVHGQSRVFERGLTPILDERIEQRAGRPRSCPHGNPVPRPDLDAAGYFTDRHALRLLDAPRQIPLAVLAISELIEDRPDLLRTCAGMGLYPGNTLTVIARDTASLTLQVMPEREDVAAHSSIPHSEHLEHEVRVLLEPRMSDSATPVRHSLAATLARRIWVVIREEHHPI